MTKNDALEIISTEIDWATKHFPPFNSAHEGLAVIEEEFEELKKEVFKNQKIRDNKLLKKEAIQVAAMAIRFLMDVVYED